MATTSYVVRPQLLKEIHDSFVSFRRRLFPPKEGKKGRRAHPHVSRTYPPVSYHILVRTLPPPFSRRRLVNACVCENAIFLVVDSKLVCRGRKKSNLAQVDLLEQQIFFRRCLYLHDAMTRTTIFSQTQTTPPPLLSDDNEQPGDPASCLPVLRRRHGSLGRGRGVGAGAPGRGVLGELSPRRLGSLCGPPHLPWRWG